MNNPRIGEIRPTDFQKGDGHIPFKGVVDTPNWASHIEFFEKQKLPDGAETDGCEFFSQQEDFDAQMDVLYPTLPIYVQDKIFNMGFMDTGLDGKEHFHSSPRFPQILSGVGTAGTSMPNVWDLARKFGVLPFTGLPSDSNITIQQYLDPASITPVMKAKAISFLNLIGGASAIRYQWVWNNKKKDLVALATALRQAPVCLGVAVTGGWNQVTPQDPPVGQTPQHAVMAYGIAGETVSILDHYEPFEKVLDAGYEIPYALQGIVNPIINVIVPQPTPLPPDIAPTPQNVNLLTQLVKLYTQLVSLFTQSMGLGSIPDEQKVDSSEIQASPLSMNTSINVVVLTASVAFIGAAATTLTTNVWQAVAELAIGLLGVYLYEKLPPSTPIA